MVMVVQKQCTTPLGFNSAFSHWPYKCVTPTGFNWMLGLINYKCVTQIGLRNGCLKGVFHPWGIPKCLPNNSQRCMSHGRYVTKVYVSGVFSTPECPPKLYVTKCFPPLSAPEIPKKSEHKILHF
jgi:hypothetical protein